MTFMVHKWGTGADKVMDLRIDCSARIFRETHRKIMSGVAFTVSTRIVIMSFQKICPVYLTMLSTFLIIFKIRVCLEFSDSSKPEPKNN